MEEEWRPVIGYDGQYEVSNLGRIKSCDRVTIVYRKRKGKILKQYISIHGYPFISLCKNGNHKSISIHKLVAASFLVKSAEHECVNHINGIKTDNNISNLEWATFSENGFHAYRLGLQKRKLDKDHHASRKILQLSLDNQVIQLHHSIRGAARKLNLKPANIRNVCNQKYRHKTHDCPKAGPLDHSDNFKVSEKPFTAEQTFAYNLKRAMASLDWDAEYLAQKSEISIDRINAMLNGEVNPNMETVFYLAAILHVKAQYFFKKQG